MSLGSPAPGGAAHGASGPSDWVTRWEHLIAPGATVLDVACGNGRHARHLAERGARVTAVDRDADAIDALHATCEAVRADIEAGEWPFPGRGWDAVVVTNYLHRPLLPLLVASLAPGGVLVYETFAQGNEAFGRPSNPAYLLRPREQLEACESLHVVAYEDGLVRRPEPARVQRIVALRPVAHEVPAAPIR